MSLYFQVFKIEFAEMKKLKEHMKSYCKLNGNHEVVFDVDRAVDGFLSYVWKKRYCLIICCIMRVVI